MDAAFLLLEVLPAAVDLVQHAGGHDGEGDQLRMAVFQCGARSPSMVFKDQDVAQPHILLEIQDAVSIGPEHVLHALGRQVGKVFLVGRGLDDDFVGADTVHAIVQPEPFAPHVSFDMQGGELVGDDADTPPLPVAFAPRLAVREDLVGRRVFVPFTEGAEVARSDSEFLGVILGPLRPVGSDDDPAADDRIFA